MPPTYYRGCWHVVSRGFLVRYRQYKNSYSPACSSLTTEFYDPKTFFTHAALLHQACAHCGRFPTAASRRSLGRVSVPMWPINLSVRLRIIQPLSSATYHYLGRPLPHQQVNTPRVHPKVIAETIFYIMTMRSSWLCGISTCFQVLSPSFGQVTHVLLTRSPLNFQSV